MILKNTNREYKIFNQPFFQYGNSKKIKLRDSFISIANGKYGDEISEKSENIVNVYTLNHFSKNSKAGLIKRDIPLNQLKNKILEYGDIVIERSGGGVNHFVGRSFMFDIQTEEIYTSVDFTRIIKLKKEDFDPKYMNFLLKFLNRNEIMEKFAQKTTKISNLKSSFFDIELHFPTIEQQIKIRNILNNHEEQITRIQYLLEKIEIRNQYYADKLTSGQLKLNNAVSIINDKFENIVNEHKKSKVMAGDSLKEGLYPFFNCSKRQTLFSNDYLIDDGVLLLSTGGTAAVNYYNGKLSYSTDVWCITSKYTKYLYYFYNANIKKVEQCFQGGGLKHLSKKDFKNIEITMPNNEKDIQDIVDYLDNLNDEKEKIEKLLKLEEQRFEWLSDKLLSGEYIIED
jgi:type I restriction enzyme S subunit